MALSRLRGLRTLELSDAALPWHVQMLVSLPAACTALQLHLAPAARAATLSALAQQAPSLTALRHLFLTSGDYGRQHTEELQACDEVATALTHLPSLTSLEGDGAVGESLRACALPQIARLTSLAHLGLETIELGRRAWEQYLPLLPHLTSLVVAGLDIDADEAEDDGSDDDDDGQNYDWLFDVSEPLPGARCTQAALEQTVQPWRRCGLLGCGTEGNCVGNRGCTGNWGCVGMWVWGWHVHRISKGPVALRSGAAPRPHPGQPLEGPARSCLHLSLSPAM